MLKVASYMYIIILMMFSVSMPIFAGENATFNMTFISLRNTPLDIYFLTDVSSSLQHTLDVLRNDITVIGML